MIKKERRRFLDSSATISSQQELFHVVVVVVAYCGGRLSFERIQLDGVACATIHLSYLLAVY
jgi:hypothetical protein